MASIPTTSLRPKQAAEFLGIGEATFWRWAKERPDFPKGIKLSPRATVYPLDKLTAWRDAQMRQGEWKINIHGAPGATATVNEGSRTVEIAVKSATAEVVKQIENNAGPVWDALRKGGDAEVPNA